MLNFVVMKIKRYGQFVNENKISIEIPLPSDIIEISNAYIKAGKDIFLVGGAVRDFVQGVNPKDYDLVTNALPNESKVILKDFKVSDEQGKNFGVLRVYTKDEPEGYEIASYRRDISGGRDTKGDDQKVEMGGDVTIEDDCNRRDLTMNALFYDIKNKQIVDLVGGVDDIKKGIVRAVGDASQRFVEDRLRICRIFRFSARTGGEIDSKTAQAIRNDNRLKGVGPKDDVSQERIWDELKKSWKQAKDYKYYLNFFTKFDMWDEVFPGANINTNLVDSKDFIVVIANLFKNESTLGLADKLAQEYKIELETSTKVTFLISLLSFKVEDVFDIYKKRQQCAITDQTILEWLKVQSIDTDTLIKFVEYRPSVSAQELMSQGFKGKELGIEIKRLEIEKFKQML
jgi:tRNA nucleotidyltransferase/poly(A) polymerase